MSVMLHFLSALFLRTRQLILAIGGSTNTPTILIMNKFYLIVFAMLESNIHLPIDPDNDSLFSNINFVVPKFEDFNFDDCVTFKDGLLCLPLINVIAYLPY